MRRKIVFLAGLAIIFLLTPPKEITRAASSYFQWVQWSTPERVPGYPPYTYSPYMVADDNGVVHAFHSQPVDGQIAIVYSQWDYDHGWTMPVDIILPANGEAQVKGILLDTKGIIHLIFAEGDQFGGSIYYTRAPALEAGRASAWSTPVLIGKDANMFAAGLATDDKGNFFVVYGGLLDGNGIYEVHSRDNGDTWSEPEAIYTTNSDELVPGAVVLLMDDNNELHIAWSNWKPPLGAQEIYYARINTDTDQSTAPLRLNGGGADTPALVKYKNSLLLIYATSGIANGVAGKAMQISNDGGRNWSNATWAFPPLVGGNGNAALVQDAKGNLYAFLGNRTGDCCHGMWYSVWQGNGWSKPQSIIQAPNTKEFDPFSPQAVVTQGNVLLVTWWNETKVNGIWYSYAKLDEPASPLTPLPTPVPSPTSSVLTANDTAPTSEAPPVAMPVTTLPPDSTSILDRSPNIAIFLGVFPILVLVTLVILWRTRH